MTTPGAGRLVHDPYLLSAVTVFIAALFGTSIPRFQLLWLGLLIAAGVLTFVSCRRGAFPGQGIAEGDPLTVGFPVFCWAMAATGFGLLDGSLGAGARTAVIALYAVLGGLAAWGALTRLVWSRPAFLVATGVHVLITGIFLMRMPVRCDVTIFLRDGTSALLAGKNPYTLTFPNMYNPIETAAFYGPGVIQNGRISYGFPYPPMSLIWAAPAQALGEVRLAGLLGLATAGIVLFMSSADRRGRVVAVLIACPPGAHLIFGMGWTETVLVAALACTAALVHRKHYVGAAVLLGLTLASKQYFVIVLPCLWLLRPYATRGRVAAFVGAPLVVSLPFLAISPQPFWRAVVEWQFIQPFRSDSLSLLVWNVKQFGWPGSSWYGALPIAAGLLVAIVLAISAPPSFHAFSAALALSLLATVLLSKQAFLNYYFIIGGALLIAAWSVAQQRSNPDPDMTSARPGMEERLPAPAGTPAAHE